MFKRISLHELCERHQGDQWRQHVDWIELGVVDDYVLQSPDEPSKGSNTIIATNPASRLISSGVASRKNSAPRIHPRRSWPAPMIASTVKAAAA